MPAGVAAPSGQVTFVFTDIESSTRLARLLGEEYQRLLDAHRRVLRAHLAIRGVELFTEGDSFFLAFADAGAAIAGCLDAQRALAGGDWPGGARPRVRMGLHTGYAVPRAGEYASPEVHRAARVASAAHGGQVLCSAAAIRAAAPLPAGVRVRDLGLHRLRGFDGRTRLLQLSAAGVGHDFPRPRTSGVVRHNLPAAPTPFVGRDRERRELAGLLREHRLVTVVGPPGVGKTRLAVRV
ncbi:MAG TPA: adenylate/guanylate cyclase domain-containing protein, partial [Pilimelia sp.]|nr:adenylate/guanylate cyclase domain-containing protein [Pilimelia sp.]